MKETICGVDVLMVLGKDHCQDVDLVLVRNYFIVQHLILRSVYFLLTDLM